MVTTAVVSGTVPRVTLRDRILWILETRDISGRELARRAGLKREEHFATLMGRLKRYPNADISRDTLVRLARGGQVSAEWLATGLGDPFEGDDDPDRWLEPERRYPNLEAVLDELEPDPEVVAELRAEALRRPFDFDVGTWRLIAIDTARHIKARRNTVDDRSTGAT